jgi:hypothetical protein
VVAVLTGHVLKDPGTGGANRPVEIDANLAEVERVMRG